MVEITKWQYAEVRDGMYHFPTEENRIANRYCSGCEHGKIVGKPAEYGFEPRVRCKKTKAERAARGIKGDPPTI